MAVFQNDPFPGVDYNAYQGWERVYGPNGQVYYVVPGNPGYVYDPVASAATGRKVFRANPSEAMKAQKEQEDQQRKLVAQQEFNQSPVGQLVPVVGSVGGMYAAHELMKPGPSLADKLIEQQLLKNSGASVATPTANAAASGALGNPVSSVSPIASSGSPISAGGEFSPGGGAYPVGETANGGTMMSDGSVYTDTLPPGAEVQPDGSILSSETGQMIGRVGQGVMGAYQIYQGFNEFRDDKVGGALGMASGAANVGAALGYADAAPFAGPLMAAKGGWDVYNSWQHGGEGIRSSGAELGAGIGTMILPGVGTVIGAVAGNALGYGLDKLGIMHKTTKQHQQERWGEVANDPNSNDYWKQAAQIHDQVMNDAAAGKFDDGEKWTLEGALAKINAGEDPSHFRMGVIGHRETFGNEWGSLSPSQQDEIIRRNAAAGNYVGDHGDIYFRDENLARQIRDEVVTDGFNTDAPPAVRGTAPATLPDAAAAGAMHRSSTRSPGIDLNGNRIRY